METRERKIGLKRKLFKLFLNDEDDFIYINENDAGIFERFAEFIAWIDKKSEEDEKKERELKGKYGEVFKTDEDGEIEDINTEAFLETSKYRIKTYQEAAEKIDAIFGQDVLIGLLTHMGRINAEVVLGGMISGLASTGLYETMRNLLADGEKGE